MPAQAPVNYLVMIMQQINTLEPQMVLNPSIVPENIQSVNPINLTQQSIDTSEILKTPQEIWTGRVSLDDRQYKNKPPKSDVSCINNAIANGATKTDENALIEAITLGKSWSPTIFDGKRNKEHFVEMHALVTDFDDGFNHLDDIVKRAAEHGLVFSFIHESFNHAPERPKYRGVFLLDEPITNYQEAKSYYEWIKFVFKNIVDKGAAEPTHFYYGGREKSVVRHNKGQTLSLNFLKEKVADYRKGSEEAKKTPKKKPAKTLQPSSKKENIKTDTAKIGANFDGNDSIYDAGIDENGLLIVNKVTGHQFIDFDSDDLVDILSPEKLVRMLEIKTALEVLDDIEICEEYDTWIEIGMALHHEGTTNDNSDFTDAMRGLFHAWSQKAPEKYEEDVTDDKWASFCNRDDDSENIKINTLFHNAHEKVPNVMNLAREIYPLVNAYCSNPETEKQKQKFKEEYKLDELSQQYLEAVDRILQTKISKSSRQKAYQKAGISSAIVEAILESHKHTLLLHRKSQEIYKYTNGYFKFLLPAEINKYITDLIKITPLLVDSFSEVSFLTNLTSTFKKEVITRISEELELFEPKFLSNIVPYDDVLVFATPEGLTFKEHDPKYRLAYKLPWKYTDDINIPKTLSFLNFALSNNQQDILFIQAFIRCAMASNNKHGKFLELVGKSGTGKSTLTEIISAIVGRDNSMPISMRNLNKGRFGTSTLVDKQLTIINEVSRYKGDTGVFQDLVGGSASIEAERKGKDGFKFTYNGNVVTNGNYLISNNDEMAALKRRRLIIRFDNVPKQPKLLFYDDGHEYTGSLVEEIPKIMAWALQLTESEAVEILKNAHNDPIQKARLEDSVAEINPVFEFVKDCFFTAGTNSDVFPQNRWKYGSFSSIVSIPGLVEGGYGVGILRKETKESTDRKKRNYEKNLPLISFYKIWCHVNNYKMLLHRKQFTNQFKLALEHFGIEYKEVSDSGVSKIVGIETTWNIVFNLAEEADFDTINK